MEESCAIKGFMPKNGLQAVGSRVYRDAMTHPDLRIRIASPAEMDIVSDLAHRIWPVCYAELIVQHERDNMLEHIYSADSLRAQQREGQIFWIASLEGQEIGFAAASADNKAVRIHKLYILPDIQGKGTGRALVNACIAYFSEGRHEAFLYMHRENLAARRFYERLGFTVTGDVPVKMGDFHYVDLVLTKSLTGSHLIKSS